MHGGDALPCVPEGMGLRDLMLEIMQKRLGITTVVDAAGRLAGVITDGDFRRLLMRTDDPWGMTARDLMSPRPTTIAPGALVASAVRQMEERPEGPITALVVIDADRRPLGVLHLHDCLRGA